MMNDKDKWSAHLEYLKTTITIAAAMLAIAATIYSDPAKMPHDFGKYILLFGVICVFITLVSAIFGVISICNLLIASSEDDKPKPDRITKWSGGAFFGLIAAGLFLTLFFGWRATVDDKSTPKLLSFDRVMSTIKSAISTQGSYAQTAIRLESLEANNNGYLIIVSVNGNSDKYAAQYSVDADKIDKIYKK